MTLSESLKRFRKEYNLTQKQVADAADVHLRLYQKYESGQTDPATTTIIDVANYFKVSADYLLGLDNSLSADENHLITVYRKLDIRGRYAITALTDFLNTNPEFSLTSSTGNTFVNIGRKPYIST